MITAKEARQIATTGRRLLTEEEIERRIKIQCRHQGSNLLLFSDELSPELTDTLTKAGYTIDSIHSEIFKKISW